MVQFSRKSTEQCIRDSNFLGIDNNTAYVACLPVLIFTFSEKFVNHTKITWFTVDLACTGNARPELLSSAILSLRYGTDSIYSVLCVQS